MGCFQAGEGKEAQEEGRKKLTLAHVMGRESGTLYAHKIHLFHLFTMLIHRRDAHVGARGSYISPFCVLHTLRAQVHGSTVL